MTDKPCLSASPGQVVDEFIPVAKMYVQVRQAWHKVSPIPFQANKIVGHFCIGKIADRLNATVSEDDGLILEDAFLIHGNDVDTSNGNGRVAGPILRMEQARRPGEQRQPHK